MSDAEAAISTMLKRRGAGKTICPSEVARDLAGTGGDWRSRMADVHRATDALAADGKIVLSWKGQPLPTRAGPYRIGLPE